MFLQNVWCGGEGWANCSLPCASVTKPLMLVRKETVLSGVNLPLGMWLTSLWDDCLVPQSVLAPYSCTWHITDQLGEDYSCIKLYETLPSNDTICLPNKQIHCTVVSVIGNYKPFMNIWVAVVKLQSTASVLQCLVDEFHLLVLVTRCLHLGLEIRCFWQPPQKVGIISMLNTQHDRLHMWKLTTPDDVLLTVSLADCVFFPCFTRLTCVFTCTLKWNENAVTLSAFQNRLRAGLV